MKTDIENIFRFSDTPSFRITLRDEQIFAEEQFRLAMIKKTNLRPKNRKHKKWRKP